MEKTPVLIVGAGPTGLVLAHELARRGVACRIIDRALERQRTSKAIAIQARSLEMFDLMGLPTDELLARGHGVAGGRILDQSRSKTIVHLDFSQLPSRYRQMFLLPQWETEQFLEDAVTSLGVRIERGVELVDLTPRDDGIEAMLRRGEAVETVRADWIVGCDGGHSTVRVLAGISFAGSTYANVFALADLHIDGELPQEEFLVYTHEEGPLAIFPMAGGRYRIIADNPPDSFTDDPSIADVQQLVDARGPGGLVLRDPIWMSRARIHRRSAGALRKGRIFIAGDAGNIHSPAGGQGMNTGMQDAFNLGWKLAMAVHGSATDLLLDSYQSERQPVEDAVVRASDFITRMVTLKSPVARFVRDHVAPLVSEIAPVKERIGESLAELTVSYRDSPITLSRAVKGAGLRAGDRAVDVEVLAGGTRTRLFAQFRGGGHVALIVGDGEATAAELDEALGPIDRKVRLQPGAAPTDWGATVTYADEPALYLIRPDGYLGLQTPLAGDFRRPVEEYRARVGLR